MLSTIAMASATPRSSLEVMLETLMQKDEQPKDAPPALPVRPTSRGRLPPSRRSLPINFKIKNDAPEYPSKRCEKREEKEEDHGGLDDKMVLKSGIFGNERMAKVNQMEESSYVKMPKLASYEERGEELDGLDSPTGPLSLANSSNEKFGGNDTVDYVLKKIVALEDTRNRTLQGILAIQKCFRGLQAHRHFQELKRGATMLQSFIRGERARHEFQFCIKRWRAAVLIQKHMKRLIARKKLEQEQKNIILVQSVIRGWLARRHFTAFKNLEMSKLNHVKVNGKPDRTLQEAKDSNQEHPQVRTSVLAEFQRKLLKAEAALRQKEEENATLQHQLQKYEMRWSEYETKMKSMEEMWQKQMSSLQVTLAQAKKSLATDDTVSQPGRLDAAPIRRYYDSEDTQSVQTRTPDSMPASQIRASNAGLARDSAGACNAVGCLVKEFAQWRQVFENDAGFLIEVKSGQSGSSMNPDDELRKLKVQFAGWKKDYKVRLRETKVALQKLGNPEREKTRRKWWCKISMRGT